MRRLLATCDTALPPTRAALLEEGYRAELIDNAIQRGWIAKERGRLNITLAGEDVLDALNEQYINAGSKGGKASSDAKAQAARENGRKGGRPPKP